jgi:hypothetical protein
VGREAALAPPPQPAAAAAAAAPAARPQRTDTRPPCAAFRSKGHCRFGASCRYSHGGPPPPGGPPAPPGSLPAVCRWYLLGVCTAGKRCPYQHALAGGAPGAGPGTEATGLLRRLLAKDVQRESSMVLQGIRALLQRYGGGGGGEGGSGSGGAAGAAGAEGGGSAAEAGEEAGEEGPTGAGAGTDAGAGAGVEQVEQ